MFANLIRKLECNTTRRANVKACKPSTTNRRRFCFEALDERTVLSALPMVVDPIAEGSQTSIELADFNQVPSGTDKTVVMSGMTYTFTPADFGFTDPNNSPPNSLLAVKLTTLPARGTMTDNGGVAAGQFISLSNLQNGNLKFTTSGTENLPFASFTFQVQDDGGTVTGGSDLDPTPKTFTLLFDNAQTNFVRGLYLELLNREPELAGLNAWLNRLAAGASTLEVATAMWETVEHRGIQVDGFYNQFLSRAPDAPGRQVWVNLMLAGVDEVGIMAAFMTTPEYLQNNSSADAFLVNAYRDLLNRDPEPAGQAFWLNQMQTGQMLQRDVATALADSAERFGILVDSYYEDFLNRIADSNGRATWVNQLTQNLLDDADVAEALLTTPEFVNLPR